MFIIRMSAALTYIIIMGSFIITYFAKKPFSFNYWIDCLFIISIICLVIGCLVIVIQGGFFDLFISTFKKLFPSKSSEVADEIENKKERRMDFIYHKTIGRWAKIITGSGLILVILSTFISYRFFS